MISTAAAPRRQTGGRGWVTDATELLRGVPILAGLDDAQLRRLSREVEFVSLRAGEWLFRAGDDARAAYVVSAGALEIIADEPKESVIRMLRRGAVVDEAVLLKRATRTVSARVRRDSKLIALRRERFDAVLRGSVGFAPALVRALALQVAGTAAAALEPPRTYAVVSLDAAVSPVRAAEALAAELGRHGTCALLDTDWASQSTRDSQDEWLTRLTRAEATHERVILVAGNRVDEWARFCLREADRRVVLTTVRPDHAWLEHRGGLADCELTLVGVREPEELIEQLAPRTTRAVSAPAGIAGAMVELARRASGRSVGIVLSGGGARALAHVGVVEELERAGAQIGRIGGVGVGALIAALVARGDSAAEIYAQIRHFFVDEKPPGEDSGPLLSLIRARKLARLLAATFGDTRIEALQKVFFCTSADVNNRTVVVHRSGPLVQALLASLSMPGLFPPMLDGKGRLLVDGGVIDNLPVSTMAEGGEGPVIAVDATGVSDRPGPESRPGRASVRDVMRKAIVGDGSAVAPLLETTLRCMTLGSAGSVSAARQRADLVISPDVSGVALLDWRRLFAMREAGVAAARQALEHDPNLLAQMREGWDL